MTRTLRGEVTSDKMDKTIVVRVAWQKEHPIYKKKYRASAKFKAHDAENQAKIGDVVEITESRPLSRQKRWTLVRKLSAKEAKEAQT